MPKLASTISLSKDVMASESHSASDRKRILIADDEPGIRDLLTEILSLEGYVPIPAANGAEAITMLREGSFDLALVDLLMPGTSGAAVARVISEERPEIPVVIVTGSDIGTIESNLGDVEVAGVIRKPFVMEDVLAFVAKLIGGP